MPKQGRQAELSLGPDRCAVLTQASGLPPRMPSLALWHGDATAFLDHLPQSALFDLIVTSPPYNIGKPYEQRRELADYLEWQSAVVGKCVSRLSPTGSICWQVGNHVQGTGRAASLLPLDVVFHPIFVAHGLKLRNRIVWAFGHGLHCKHRFSGRYEVVLWYTKTDDYKFHLDRVRVEPKYPGKKHFKGPRAGEYSCNPLGKNPEDVWQIPNVKSNHVEKTVHPCQFPVGLVERLVLALTDEEDLVFDPFAGVASAGVAAALRGRRFWGCEPEAEYVEIGRERIDGALCGVTPVRPLDRPIHDPALSGRLAQNPFRAKGTR